MKELVELRFYQEKNKSIIYIDYNDKKGSEKTIKIDYDHLRKELPNLPKEIHELARRILDAYEKDAQ